MPFGFGKHLYTFTDTTAGFEVTAPVQLKPGPPTTPPAPGYVSRQFAGEHAPTHGSFNVGYVIAPDASGLNLKGAVNGMIRGGGLILGRKDTITVAGSYPGRELTGTKSESGLHMEMTARVFQVDNRIIMMIVMSEAGYADQKINDDFFNSFKLLSPAP